MRKIIILFSTVFYLLVYSNQGNCASIEQSATQTYKTIALDAVSTAFGSSTSFTFSGSHTVAANATLVVAVYIGYDVSNPTGVSVLWGNRALTQQVAITNSGDCRIELWYLSNAEAGTKTVTVNLNKAAGNGAVARAISFTGVDLDSPIDTSASYQSESDNPSSLPITTGVDNAWVVDALGNFGFANTLTAGAGQTAQWSNAPNAQGFVGSTKAVAAAGATTMAWTHGSTMGGLATCAISLKPAPIAMTIQGIQSITF